MACDDKKRGSIALPTIEESDEDLDDIVKDILRSTRKKKECRTPSKKDSNTEKSKSDLSARKRTPRQCAEQAREKITTLFNQGDKYGRSIYTVSESGSSEDSSEAFLPIAEDEMMPKGECKNDSFTICGCLFNF